MENKSSTSGKTISSLDKQFIHEGYRDSKGCRFWAFIIALLVDGHVTGEGTDDGGAHVKTDCYCKQCKHHWHPRNLDEDFRIDE